VEETASAELESEWGTRYTKSPFLTTQNIRFKTMQDFFFATFVYVAMICFVCYLRYQPSLATTVATDIADLPTDEPQQVDINPAPIAEPEQKLEPTHALIEDTLVSSTLWSKPTQVTEPVVSVDSQRLLDVGTQDTSKLTLRQCRAVIREINKSLPKEDRIRQKINGKDAPINWLRSQIARYA